jgi:hypothetical protein
VNPHIKKRKWTPEEDATIFAMHAIHGTKWVVIASALEGRCVCRVIEADVG